MRDITLETTFYQYFTTRAFATGIPTTLAGTPVISAYEDNNVTQITAGVSLTVDFDGVTGLNLITVVATAANGFENGKSYALVITTGTVGGVSVVGEVVGEFTIGQSAAAVDLANVTDGLGAIKADTAATLVDTAVIGAAGAGLTDLGGMSATMKGQVNAEVVDVVGTDTLAELAQAAPSATPTINAAIMALYMALRNKIDVTAAFKEFHNDAGTVIFKKALSDDGATYTEAEAQSGP